MNLYEILQNSVRVGEGMTHFERLFAQKVGGGKINEISGVPPLRYIGNGTPLADYRISGNTVQDGTPSPDMPVDVVGCGVRTGNLIDIEQYNEENVSKSSDGSYFANAYQKWGWCIPTEIGKTYTVSVSVMNEIKIASNLEIALCKGYRTSYTSEDGTYGVSIKNVEAYQVHTRTFNFTATDEWLTIVGYKTHIYSIMINEGSTALPYEPYGYKLPLTVNGTEYPIYLGQVPTTRRIKKLVLTGEEDWSEITAGLYRITVNGYLRIAYMQVGMSSHFNGGYAIESVPSAGSDELTFSVSDSGNNYVYLSSHYLTTAEFKSYLAQQYANGTPVTIWYILAEPETGIVNEPLMKIGDYADTISMAQAGVTIPTVSGANILDVPTKVPPSEVWIRGKIKEV